MINRIVGTPFEVDKEKCVVEIIITTEGGGFSFTVRLTQKTMDDILKTEGNCNLLIHTHKTEQADTLYGFLTEAERRMFREFIKLDRLGPATAIKILGFPMDVITSRIVEGNWQFFAAISGIGEKTAKSIILELQKKFRKG